MSLLWLCVGFYDTLSGLQMGYFEHIVKICS
jgi:hypothetical protein